MPQSGYNAIHIGFGQSIDRLADKMNSTQSRDFPDRPYVAVSAAIIRDGSVLIVRRANPPMQGIFTLPGGVVEAGETLHQALIREIAEETNLVIEPVALAGHREVITRSVDGRTERHFIILAFAARWVSGEPKLNHELAEARWLTSDEIAPLRTTEGLRDIIAAAFERMKVVR
jgi:8-oxo-dGTP diphosphatase